MNKKYIETCSFLNEVMKHSKKSCLMAGRPRTRNVAYIGVDFFGQQFQLFGRQRAHRGATGAIILVERHRRHHVVVEQRRQLGLKHVAAASIR